MLKPLRHQIIKNLFSKFHRESPQMQLIADKLVARGMDALVLDHFALIDLPGSRTGISQLGPLFESIGYIIQGQDYLPDKQNDFLWLAEKNAQQTPAREVLPQVVVADFRLDEMPIEIKKIIEKYAAQSAPSPLAHAQKLAKRVYLNDFDATKELNDLFIRYLGGRDWPLPTKQEFCSVFEFNQLLAWVLIFGRRPNHFTLAVHLLNDFKNLEAFLTFIKEEVKLALNLDGGVIKGNPDLGVEQGSTLGVQQHLQLVDGEITVLSEFVEFIWRFPRTEPAVRWEDFYVGFLPQNANQVIESLYLTEK